MMAEYIPLRCAIIVLQLWHKGGGYYAIDHANQRFEKNK